jgi:hypothetical protein
LALLGPHLGNEFFEFLPFVDPLADLRAQFAGHMEGVRGGVLLPGKQGRFVDGPFFSAPALGVAAFAEGDRQGRGKKGADFPDGFQRPFALGAGDGFLGHMESINTFHTKVKQKDPLGEEIF